jgi:mannitol-1-/sugar-/sorbitol-6-phosphatase
VRILRPPAPALGPVRAHGNCARRWVAPPGFRAWLSALDVRWLDGGEGRARTFCSSDDYSTLMTELECDAVLFDLDGVLVDSAACVERHWRRWAGAHHLDPADIMRLAHGRPTVETIRLVAPHLPAEAEAARLDAAEAFDIDGVVPVTGAAELVRSLPANAWAIATSGTRDTALTRMRHTGLPLPAVLITADDVQRGKPNPDAYLLAAARLNVTPARCVVVEDAPAGVSAAHAAGMRVVALATTHPQPELREADVRAERLMSVQISSSNVRPGGRLVIRVTEV